jgi:hypothetical protein
MLQGQGQTPIQYEEEEASFIIQASSEEDFN